MALLSQQLSSLLPMPLRPNDVPAANRNEIDLNPVMGSQARQSEVDPVTPAAVTSTVMFPTDFETQNNQPEVEDGDLVSLLEDMENIDNPPAKGELLDIRVPRADEEPP